MLELCLTVALCSLAAGALVELWEGFHFLQPYRQAVAERKSLIDAGAKDRWRYLWQLLDCPFCFSHHIAAIVLLAWWLSSFLPTVHYGVRAVVAWLAACRLVTLYGKYRPK